MADRTEIFYCSAPHSDHRKQLAAQCMGWWKEQKGIKLYVLNPSVLGCTAGEFNRERRIWAERHAKGAIYVVVDDDCMPTSQDCIETGVQALTCHPTFAIISAFPANCHISRWTPEGYSPWEDLDVMEHINVGGLRFMRRGAMTEWPMADGPAYDDTQCRWLRHRGYRVGYSQHARVTHLGEGASDRMNSVTSEAMSWNMSGL